MSIGIVFAGAGGLGKELFRDLSSGSAVNELLLGSGIFQSHGSHQCCPAITLLSGA